LVIKGNVSHLEKKGEDAASEVTEVALIVFVRRRVSARERGHAQKRSRQDLIDKTKVLGRKIESPGKSSMLQEKERHFLDRKERKKSRVTPGTTYSARVSAAREERRITRGGGK